jgi:predicted glutamine amidotransferase
MREFARHGGLAADNADGWGIAYDEEGDARVFRDVGAAAAGLASELANVFGRC